MNRAYAYAHLWIAATESAYIVEKCLSAPCKLEHYRLKLLNVRKKLLGTLNLAQVWGWKKTFTSVLYPLDHAYKTLDMAMQGHFIDEDGVRVCLAMLKQASEAIGEKGWCHDVA